MHMAARAYIPPATDSLKGRRTIAERSDNPVARFDLDHVAAAVFHSIEFGNCANHLALDIVARTPLAVRQRRHLKVAVVKISNACQ